MVQESLAATVATLHRILTATVAGQARPTAEDIRRQAHAAAFADPTRAAEVYELLTSRKGEFVKEFSLEDVSDAFLTLLWRTDEGEEAKPSRANAWHATRTALRQIGQRVGQALLAIHKVLLATGMGFAPTLNQLLDELREILRRHARPEASVETMLTDIRGQARAGEIGMWHGILLAALVRRRQGRFVDETLIGAEDLEEVLLDSACEDVPPQECDTLKVYQAQARSFRAHRCVGFALATIS
jgi:hypothetical protein